MAVVPINTDALISKFLTGPVDEFLARPKKDLRSELVRIGFMLYAVEQPGREKEADLLILSSMLEWIHGGSLIVDDIQDDSLERRGQDCLHRLYGIPCALNAANWMYFEALKKLNETSLDESQKLKMYQLTLQMMSAAHEGQAIDLMGSVYKIPREDIYELGMRSHELKSGVIFSLALQLGALLADPQADLAYLSQLGLRLGSSLQRFDDLGNICFQKSSPKALEDLRLGRPTWVWMFVAKYRTPEDYLHLQTAAMRLPDQKDLEVFLTETNIWNEALSLAKKLHLDIEFFLEGSFPGRSYSEGIHLFKAILKKVLHAYV